LVVLVLPWLNSVRIKIVQIKKNVLDCPEVVRTIIGVENTLKVTDGITEGIEAHKLRGLEIAALAKIEKNKGIWLVAFLMRSDLRLWPCSLCK